MALAPDPQCDDRHLRGYLLGLLTDEHAERLDELSIADSAFAWRLRLLEDDLVDAYVRGSLDAESLEQFESFYLDSPWRREKVNFAASFLHAIAQTGQPAPVEGRRDVLAGLQRTRHPHSTSAPLPAEIASPLQARWKPPTTFAWQRAGVASLLLVVLALGALLLQQQRLRTGLAAGEHQVVTLEQRVEELEQQLTDRRQPHPGTVSPVNRGDASPVAVTAPAAAGQTAPPATPPTTTLTLLPQTRTSGPVATLTLPPGAERVPFRLQLESIDFPTYQVELKDPATDRTAWRSFPLTATAAGKQPSVRVSVMAAVMKSQLYSFELKGLDAAGRTQVIDTYLVQILP
jgi:hypothetical protein